MIDSVVVDANVVVKWVVAEEHSAEARLLTRMRLSAPGLLFIECANLLWKKVRLGELKPEDAYTGLDFIMISPVEIVGSAHLLKSAIRISIDLKHPVYDCLYLALAQQRKIPLVTADGRLANLMAKRKHLGIRVEFLSTFDRS